MSERKPYKATITIEGSPEGYKVTIHETVNERDVETYAGVFNAEGNYPKVPGGFWWAKDAWGGSRARAGFGECVGYLVDAFHRHTDGY